MIKSDLHACPTTLDTFSDAKGQVVQQLVGQHDMLALHREFFR